jgi:hypothetical protein
LYNLEEKFLKGINFMSLQINKDFKKENKLDSQPAQERVRGFQGRSYFEPPRKYYAPPRNFFTPQRNQSPENEAPIVQKVTSLNILNSDSRGSIIASKVNDLVHSAGIFGAYIGNDPKAITTLVAAHHLFINNHNLRKNNGLTNEQWIEVATDINFELNLTCFNFETINQIKLENKNSEERKKEFKSNMRFISKITSLSEFRIEWDIQYYQTRNDLNDGDDSNWKKLNRFFENEMVFLNPYGEPSDVTPQNFGKGTQKLLASFFEYAQTNLNDDGVVTVMWNPCRKDGLKIVEVPKIAALHGFKIAKICMGSAFTELTSFSHYKNFGSYNKAIENGTSAIISSKKTDTIILFKKIGKPPHIPKSAKIATAFLKRLPKAHEVAKDILFAQYLSGLDALNEKNKKKQVLEEVMNDSGDWINDI